jgi:hypothetical protein
MVVMDRLSLDRNLKERRIVGWCGKAVDSQGCDIGCWNRLVGSIGSAMDSKNLNVGGCGHAVGSCGRAVGGQGVSWKGRDQSRNNWDGSNLSSGGWATAREVGDAAKAVGLQRWRIDFGKGGAGQ